MIPQSIKDAFDGGWNIKTEDEAEKMAFLYECSDLNMMWAEGQAALDYTPRAKGQVYFSTDWGNRLKCSSWSEGIQTINWSALNKTHAANNFRFIY